jgi:hypothetical protein
MADRQVSVEFVFDRAGERGLAQAYRVLVPQRRGRTTNRRDADERSEAPRDREQRPALGA